MKVTKANYYMVEGGKTTDCTYNIQNMKKLLKKYHNRVEKASKYYMRKNNQMIRDEKGLTCYSPEYHARLDGMKFILDMIILGKVDKDEK